MMNENFRLQLLTHEEVFNTREDAVSYINDYFKPEALKSEPACVYYGDEKNPQLLIAVGTGNRKVFLIDFALLEGIVEEMGKTVESNKEMVIELNESVKGIVSASGLNYDSNKIEDKITYEPDSKDILISEAKSLSEAIDILSKYAQKETIKVESTDSISLSKEEGVIKAEVNISNVGDDDTADFNDNIIGVKSDGLYASAYMDYDTETKKLTFITSGFDKRGNFKNDAYKKVFDLGQHTDIVVKNKNNSPVVLAISDVDESTKEISGKLKISEDVNNILEIQDGNLLVNGKANNIAYKDKTVAAALNELTKRTDELERDVVIDVNDSDTVDMTVLKDTNGTTFIKSDVKLANNKSINVVDGGLNVNIDFEIDTIYNKLIVKVGDIVKELTLPGVDIIDSVIYDKVANNVIISFKNGSSVTIPMGDFFKFYRFENNVMSPIVLTEDVNTSDGHHSVSASLKLRAGDNAISVNDQGELYVSITALTQDLTNAITTVINKISSVEQELKDMIHTETDRATEIEKSLDNKIDTVDTKVDNLKVATETVVNDIKSDVNGLNTSIENVKSDLSKKYGDLVNKDSDLENKINQNTTNIINNKLGFDTFVSETKSDIQTIKTTLKNVDDRLIVTETTTSVNEQKIVTNSNNIETNRQNIEKANLAIESEKGERISAIENEAGERAKIDAELTGKIELSNSAIENETTRAKGEETRIEDKIDTVDTKVVNVSDTLVNLSNKLEVEVGKLNSADISLSTKISEVKSIADSNTTAIERHENTISELTKSRNDLNERLALAENNITRNTLNIGDEVLRATEAENEIKSIIASEKENVVDTLTEKIDGEVEDINASIASNVETINHRIDDVDETINHRIDDEVKDINTSIASNVETITSNTVRITTLENSASDFTNKFKTLDDITLPNLNRIIADNTDKITEESDRAEAKENELGDLINDVNEKVGKKIETVELLPVGNSNYIYQLIVDGKPISEINIPKEQVIKNASYNTELHLLTLSFLGENIDPIVIDLNGLMDVYEAGDGIKEVVDDNGIIHFAIRIDNKVTDSKYLKLDGEGFALDLTGYYEDVLKAKIDGAIENVKNELNSNLDNLGNSTSAELKELKDKVQANSDAISTNITEIVNIKNRLDQHDSAINNLETKISDNLDEKLSGIEDKLKQEENERKAEDNHLAELLDTEKTERKLEAKDLSDKIDKEISDRENAIGNLNTTLSKEITDINTGITIFENTVTNKLDNNSKAIEGIDIKVASIEKTHATDIRDLSGLITTEITNRTTAVSNVITDLQNEANNRFVEDGKLRDLISDTDKQLIQEISDRQFADQALRTDINSNTTKITKNTSDIGDLSGLITTEISERKDADVTINNKFVSVDASIKSVETKLESTKEILTNQITNNVTRLESEIKTIQDSSNTLSGRIDNNLTKITENTVKISDLETKLAQSKFVTKSTETISLQSVPNADNVNELSGNVNISQTSGNILRKYSDGLGVIVSIDYNEATNTIIFNNGDGIAKTFTLKGVTAINDVKYDPNTKKLIFETTTSTGELKTTAIDVTDFFKGIGVENDETNLVKLFSNTNEDGVQILSATVKIDGRTENAIQTASGSLYVSPYAEDMLVRDETGAAVSMQTTIAKLIANSNQININKENIENITNQISELKNSLDNADNEFLDFNKRLGNLEILVNGYDSRIALAESNYNTLISSLNELSQYYDRLVKWVGMDNIDNKPLVERVVDLEVEMDNLIDFGTYTAVVPDITITPDPEEPTE